MSLGRPTRNMDLIIHDEGTIDHNLLLHYEENEHIDWTDTDEDFLTLGTLDAGAITGTSLTDGYATLEDGNLDLLTVPLTCPFLPQWRLIKLQVITKVNRASDILIGFVRKIDVL